MQICNVKRKDGTVQAVPCYAWDELDFPDLPVMISSRGQGSNKIGYLSDFATFDIESTTMPGKVLTKKGKKEWVEKPWAFMYHWQVCFAGDVIIGRRWEEFSQLLGRLIEWYHLKKLKRLVIYVFNLGFEFSFMYPFLEDWIGKWDLFATGSHTPVKVTGEMGIEFRCAWKLTNMSLYMFTKTEKDCPYQKAWGDLDYDVIRTPDTPLNEEKELPYCVIDVLGLYYALKSRMKADHDTIATIPLTSTGYPRRDTRRACRADKDYREKVFKKCLLTITVWQLMKELRRGGDTHASRYLVNKIYELVISYDYVSLYPAVLMMELFPITAFTRYGEIESMDEFNGLLASGRAVIFRVWFQNLRLKPREPMPYIPVDKLTSHPGKKRIKADNGRVLAVDCVCSMTLTEIDWAIIKDSYEWDPGLIIKDVHVATKGPLPEPIRKTIMSYFALKCELKEQIKETEKALKSDPKNKALIDRLNELDYRYGKIKNKLNGIFGMAYTSPVREECTMDDKGEWKEKLPEGKTEEDLLNKFNKSRNSFLVYAWGPYCTAYARRLLRRLQECTIDASGLPAVIYSDTDSAKSQYWDEAKLADLIRSQQQKADACGAYYVSKSGKRYYMGYPEKDGIANKFKTLGAKKYAYIDDKKVLHVTVSGVSNAHAPGDELGAGARELLERGHGLDSFKVGFVFADAGGQTIWYGHKDPQKVTVNGCTFLTASYAALTDGEYTLGQTEEYKRLLGSL